jgi:hypothetical protein
MATGCSSSSASSTTRWLADLNPFAESTRSAPPVTSAGTVNTRRPSVVSASKRWPASVVSVPWTTCGLIVSATVRVASGGGWCGGGFLMTGPQPNSSATLRSASTSTIHSTGRPTG